MTSGVYGVSPRAARSIAVVACVSRFRVWHVISWKACMAGILCSMCTISSRAGSVEVPSSIIWDLSARRKVSMGASCPSYLSSPSQEHRFSKGIHMCRSPNRLQLAFTSPQST